jgi:hypothetical protein
MTLTIDLPAEREAQLRAEAQERGLSPEETAGALLADLLAEREAEDAEDLETLRYRRENPDPRPRKTLDDLRAHIAAQSEHKQAA